MRYVYHMNQIQTEELSKSLVHNQAHSDGRSLTIRILRRNTGDLFCQLLIVEGAQCWSGYVGVLSMFACTPSNNGGAYLSTYPRCKIKNYYAVVRSLPSLFSEDSNCCLLVCNRVFFNSLPFLCFGQKSE